MTIEGVGIYVASRKKNANLLRSWRDRGFQIISSWIDNAEKPAWQALQSEVWRAALSEISKCESFIFYDGGDGALVELGAAIGMGVPRVIVVQERGALILLPSLPCVIWQKTLEESMGLAQSCAS